MSLQGRVMAAVNAWMDYGKPLSGAAQSERYALLGAFYQGTWTSDGRWKYLPTDIYRNARQIVKHTGAIVDCYEQLVYQGEMPTFGKELPEGTMLALPVEPETGGVTTDDALLRAFYTAFDIGKWQQLTSLVPRTAAIFGDCLVELVDDYARGVVSPNVVNPWLVPVDSLELDYAGNVKRYAVEYDVTIEASTAFGRDVKAEAYRYRKEVDRDAFRFYKDSKPWTDPNGHGEAVQPNPYTFVPAAWFRHEQETGCDRGKAAFERTLMPALEVSSLLSSAIDYQRKKFGFPIGVKGSALRGGKTYTLPGGLSVTTPSSAADVQAAQRQSAESQNFLPLDEHGEFVTVQFDIGQTRELLAFLDDNMVAENPEAKYAQLLAELKMATGPGVSMTLAPIKAKVRGAQRNHDPRMIALAQMTTAMMGFRLNSGAIPAELVAGRKDRYDAFRPFDLTSYGRGLLDASMASRDPFPESKLEKAQWVTLVDGMSPWGMREMGVSEEDIAQLEQQRQADRAAFDVNLTGIGAAQSTNANAIDTAVAG
jgi:hypothetical protein